MISLKLILMKQYESWKRLEIITLSVFNLMAMSDIYVEKGVLRTALNYAQKSLILAEQYGFKGSGL